MPPADQRVTAMFSATGGLEGEVVEKGYIRKNHVLICVGERGAPTASIKQVCIISSLYWLLSAYVPLEVFLLIIRVEFTP